MKIKQYQRILLLLLLSLPLHLWAQETPVGGNVTGIVVEGPQKTPLGFANVVLLTPRDSSVVAGATTDISGKFLLQPVPFGKYILRASLVGYPTKYVTNITVSADYPSVALGTITMETSNTRLDEVEIVAQRDLVEYDLDKRVVNVSQDIASKTGTVADVLQNVPSVTVDIDGNVSLRGSSNVTILVDGKRTSLANLSLDQIPANLIESIELVTNPSSKYDPEGTSGIINLILKEEREPGLNGSASVNVGTYENYSTSLNLNYQVDKWSISGGYDFRHRTRPGVSSNFTTYYTDDLPYTFLDQVRERDNLDLSHNFRLGADYQLTPKKALSASVFYRTEDEEGSGDLLYRFLDENRELVDTRTRVSKDSEEGYNMDLNLGYRQTFERKGQELTADLVYATNADDEISEWEDDDLGVLIRQNTLTDDENTRFTAQADYIHPISENSNLEAGFRSSFQRLDEDTRFFDYNYEINDFVFNDTISNHFVYDEQVHAAYANYSNKYKSFSYQVGLRAEQTFTTSDQRTQDMVYENNYFSLFPSLFITHDINEDNKVQFSYSRRINRPRSRYLNPFVDRTDKFDVDFGNPRLNPEFINSLELGYLRYWDNSSLNFSTFYRHTTDQIQRLRRPAVVTENGETYTRLETTFLNLSSGSSYGVEIGATHSVGKWWRLNGSVSGYRTELNDSQGDTELSNSQLTWSSRLNSTMTLWDDWQIQVNAFYRAPQATIQGRMEQLFSTDLGINKDVLDKRGTISLRVSDIFNTREWNFVSYEEGVFRSVSNNKRQSRIIYLGFTYRLNNEDNRERNRRNDDDQGGGEDFDF
ncbi:outer membrane receptor protein involved in Fe transport [Pontibacter ummariensis]|uniref:Outer membrane receptor proteins, mostly Fe transport n=1 Tax=Pontibacter ummariensis TaxID=1610492 RepID=A0A239IKB1_9BACT|nr:outer membrane beta-barrel family protein [Pontibacter ummariensis]PRY09888.1 outer membrane receptor protein involved in Fe transport [Pontibacter ummariensis]SNS93979.1 Outer membrane receptor proteins, mostly Fe transport [Pontibacter ummariensis]